MTDENGPRVARPDGMPAAQPTTNAAPAAQAAFSSAYPGAEDAASASGGRPARDSGSLSPERCTEIRRRMYQGAYDTGEVLEVVARRLLASGDLQPER